MFRDKVIIIAEAGVNHNGSIQLAKQLIDAAVEAGVDIVKFQTFKTENLVSKDAKKADYQIENTTNTESQFDMLKKLELTQQQHIELISYCKLKNIQFWSTAFDNDSISLLKSLGIDLWKIPSGEITNLPYLEKIGSFNQKVIISTGMCNMQEIEEAIAVLTNAGTAIQNITILHCNTEYPTPMCDVNLLAINTIKEKFKTAVGYSDHTQGIEVPIAAVAIGATVIEKHFTLDRNMEGPDHKASLEPTELKQMVISIRNIELALGNGVKEPSPSEQKNKAIARKSIVAAKKIEENEILTENNLTIKRPGNGINPMKWYEVIGKKAKRSFAKDELIEL
jgi:N,N'-diacetyllegionaminate synthase